MTCSEVPICEEVLPYPPLLSTYSQTPPDGRAGHHHHHHRHPTRWHSTLTTMVLRLQLRPPEFDYCLPKQGSRNLILWPWTSRRSSTR